MSSLWTDLLFLHGHIADPELARRLENTPPREIRSEGDTHQPSTCRTLLGWPWRLCLGIGDGCLRVQ